MMTKIYSSTFPVCILEKETKEGNSQFVMFDTDVTDGNFLACREKNMFLSNKNSKMPAFFQQKNMIVYVNPEGYSYASGNSLPEKYSLSCDLFLLNIICPEVKEEYGISLDDSKYAVMGNVIDSNTVQLDIFSVEDKQVQGFYIFEYGNPIVDDEYFSCISMEWNNSPITLDDKLIFVKDKDEAEKIVVNLNSMVEKDFYSCSLSEYEYPIEYRATFIPSENHPHDNPYDGDTVVKAIQDMHRHMWIES